MNQHTILVVEDNPITRKMMRVALEIEGYRVLEAAEGRSALGLMAEHSPDLVLQDLILPDMDGLELLRRFRALTEGRHVPILGISGFVSRLEEARATGVGFDDVLLKPVEPSLLRQVLHSFLPLAEAGPQTIGGGRRVLVADDDAIQRKLLAFHLGSLGFRVEAAGDGAEALERARTLPPDAILSDVFMPRLDGFALCLAVRQDPALSRIPVVLFSSMYVEEGDRALGREVGANAWVDRSPDFKELVEALLGSLGAPAPAPAVESTQRVMAEHTERLVRQLERQASLNATLTQRAALQVAELSVLSGIADSLARTRDVEATLAEMLYRCLDAGGLSRGALYLTRPDGRPFLEAKMGYEDVPAGGVEGFFGHADLLQEIIEAGSPVVIPSAAVPEAAAQAILDRSKGTQSLIAPITSQGIPLGAILMGTRSRTLTEEDWLFFARTVAVQIGQAISLSRMFSRVAASERRYRGIFESTRDAMLLADADGRVIDANPAACGLAGYTLEELRALQVTDLVRRGTGEGQATEGASRAADDALVTKGGGERVVEASASPIDGSLCLHVLHDVTEQRRAEESLRQSEKLATMGQLLAGVAHELNNPLSVAMGQATLLAANLQGSPLLERADKIVVASERCARIVGNFLALARQRPPERKRVVLNQVVEQAVELLAYQLRVDTVKVRMDLDPDLPVLWADPHQLHQVVVNLISNAHQAMRDTPPPRALTLVTRFDPATGRVVLAVADTGPGIPPHIRARIFEPFFTTKPPGQGTGLGLSLCQGIIEGHGGAIRVESQPGEGATFVIELLVSPPPAAAPEARAEEAAAPLREKSILIVDDEPVIVELLADILSLDGHQIETAADGALALEKLRERTYDLILSDIRMPRLDGPGLYREVQRRHPDLCRRFIFLTGDLLSQETREFLEQTGVTSVSKPIAVEEVRRAVQRALAPPAISSRGTPG